MENDKICFKCSDNADVMITSCNHFVVCSKCIKSLQDGELMKCPVCNESSRCSLGVICNEQLCCRMIVTAKKEDYSDTKWIYSFDSEFAKHENHKIVYYPEYDFSNEISEKYKVISEVKSKYIDNATKICKSPEQFLINFVISLEDIGFWMLDDNKIKLLSVEIVEILGRRLGSYSESSDIHYAIKLGKSTDPQIYQIYNFLTRVCIYPWKLSHEAVGSGTCYYGNFGKKPSSLDEAMNILDLNTKVREINLQF